MATPYESTNRDIGFARILGIIYVLLSLFLAYMLFVIWPPIPWPTTANQRIDPEVKAQLEQEARNCGCLPSSTSTGNQTSTTSSTTPGTSPAGQTGGGVSDAGGPNAGQTPKGTGNPTGTQPGASSAGQPASGDNRQPGSSEPSNNGEKKPEKPNAEAKDKTVPMVLPTKLPIKFLRWCVCTTFDERLILLVIVAGMLGALVHAATSLADFIGNYNFKRTWTWFYLLRPFIGMSLALVFYFVIRGGFLTTNTGAQDINPYGIAALAGMVGMFSKQAADKLGEVFSTLFKSEGDKKRSDPLALGSKPTIGKIDTSELKASSASKTIKVNGTNFVKGATVNVNDVAQVTTFVSATELTAKVDGTFAAGDTVKVKVVNPNADESAETEVKVGT